MKKLLVPATLAAITVIAIAVASGSAQTAGGRTLTLFENVANESNSLVDNAPKSPAKNPDSASFRLSRGDELVGRTPLLDHKGGTRVGTSYFQATVAKGRKFEGAVLQAQVVLALRDGNLVLEGLAGSTDNPLAVVGGTGAYEGARGQTTEKETDHGAVLTIQLLP